mmetsp:Transcript_2139/g.3003  ORF Transcript_2139/g.3003 Transcript_2139/m.3003 type:complete len:202 (+) Transcript_2139:838-1443(+)
MNSITPTSSVIGQQSNVYAWGMNPIYSGFERPQILLKTPKQLRTHMSDRISSGLYIRGASISPNPASLHLSRAGAFPESNFFTTLRYEIGLSGQIGQYMPNSSSSNSIFSASSRLSVWQKNRYALVAPAVSAWLNIPAGKSNCASLSHLARRMSQLDFSKRRKTALLCRSDDSSIGRSSVISSSVRAMMSPFPSSPNATLW